jgi:transposase-like protein
VLELLSGKATVDQLAHRFGVLPATIEGWREDAVAGISEALKRGTGKSGRELELEAENAQLRDALASATLQVQLFQREAGLRPRPTRPARSRR